MIVDVITSVTGGCEESAIIGFINQCKEMGSAGNAIVIGAHPADISGDSLNRLRSLSESYLALRIEKNGNQLDNVIEIFKSGAGEYMNGNRFNFEVEPGSGIQVSQIQTGRRGHYGECHLPV